uniref:HAT C-terminal dimerisation domain-containing protein n=2 Tax=Nothobranchius pienaari TaxID=704102 RepID=A0A1A8LFD7_9TELE
MHMVPFSDTLFLIISVAGLWDLLDSQVSEKRKVSSATANATVEVQRYLVEPNIPRGEDPLKYWAKQKHVYPSLYVLAKEVLCIPASSVPCERVFSKAGEVVSKKRNRLSPGTVEQILFLNKNDI